MKKYIKMFICGIILVLSLCFFTSCANERKNYSINFIIDDSVYTSINTPGKELIIIPEPKQKENFEFDGWYFDNNIWNESVLRTSFYDNYLENDVNVYAHYIQKNITSDYDCSIIDYGDIEHEGSHLSLDVDSSKSSLNFNDEITVSDGCSVIIYDETKNNELDNIVNLNYGMNKFIIKVVLNDYINKEYSISINRTNKLKCEFLDNDGNVIERSLYDIGSIIKIPDYKLSKKGYSFKGWGLINSTDIVDGDYEIQSNCIFEPKFEKEVYAILYNLDGGINNIENPTSYFISDNSISIKSPTKEGHIFKGWRVEGLSSESLYSDFSIEPNSVGDVSLTAIWEPDGDFDIVYDLQGGVNNILNPTMYSVSDGIVNVLYEPTREGYTFVGWTSDFNFTPKKNLSFSSSYKRTVSLKANWAVHYNIIYNLDGGNNPISNPMYYTTIDDDFVIFEPTRYGYTFDGWNVNNSESTIKNLIVHKGTTGVLNLKAVWSKINYTISYVLNGGSNNIHNVTSYTIADSISIYAPTKQYSTFVGWSLYNGTPTKNYVIPEGSTGNITLYANWKDYNLTVKSKNGISSDFGEIANPIQNDYVLSFDSKGGSTISSQTITKTNKMVYPTTIPTRSGYSFTGWYSDYSCTQLFDFTSNISCDTTVYAGWLSMVSSSYYSKNYRNSVSYNSSSSCVSESMSGTSSSAYNYDYFTVLNDGTYYIYYKTSSTASYYRIYLYICNQTKGTVIKSNGYISNTSYVLYSFTASAGDVIYLRTYRYSTSYSPTFSFYISGMKYPNAGGGVSNGYKLLFNSTGGTSVPSQIIDKNGIITYPTTIPIRSGYSFTGWYKDSSCTQLFDFTSNIYCDTTVYAGWLAMESSSYYSRNYRNSVSYNSSSSCVSESMSGTNSSTYNYDYFTVLNDGTYYIYYKTSSTSYYYRINLFIYNQTKGTVIKSDGYISNTSYASYSFTASAGDVIYIRTYRYNTSYSPTFSFYISGMKYPSDGGTALGFTNATHAITAGTKYTFTVINTANFIGWYENGILISTDYRIDYTMPEKDVVLEARVST